MRWKGATAAIVLMAGLAVGLLATSLSETLRLLEPDSEASACSTVSIRQPAAPAWPVTYQDFSYHSDQTADADRTDALRNPTQDNPQSKLWYNDGSWWGAILDRAGEHVRIHELLAMNIWGERDTIVDERPDSTADVVWDGTKLFIASRHPSEPLRVLRFSYDPEGRTYDLDSGFPVSIDAVGSSSAVIEQDSTGRLWVAYIRSRSVWVAHSALDQLTWDPPFVPPVRDTDTASEDVAALVAFDGRIGLMWSNQESNAFRFAIHEDGAPPDEWSFETALVGPSLADNHIDLKSDGAGRVYAAVKTSQGADAAHGPLTLLLVRQPDGVWTDHVFGTYSDRHTRPIAVIDETNELVHMFATRGSRIFYKRSPLADISFPAGPGAPFMEWPGISLNNVTASKHPVDADTELVVLASSPDDLRYYHASLDIMSADGRVTATPTPPPTGPISFRAASAGSNSAANYLTLDRPATVVPGDVLLASVDAADTPGITPPPGWQMVRDDNSGTTMRKATFWRLADDAEPPTYTWRFSTAASSAGVILAYGGVNAENPIEAATGRVNDESESIVASSAIVTSAGAQLVSLFGMATLTDIELPDSMVERAEAGTDDGPDDITSSAADTVCPRRGATGEITAVAPRSATSIGQLVILRPQASASRPTPDSTARPTEAAPLVAVSPSPSPLPSPPLAAMADEITFRSASVAANSGELYLSIELPDGVVAGDLLLASIDARGTPEIVAPFGWRLIREDESGTTMRKATFFRIVGNAEPEYYIWYLTKPQPASGIILAYAGVDPVYPIESSNGYADELSSREVRAASIDVGIDDAVLVAFFGIGTFAEVTPPPRMNRRAEVNTPEARYRITSVAADRRYPEHGVTGDLAAASDRSAKGIGQLVVLRPAE